MTDRTNGFWVVLEDTMRVDDAKAIMDAVKQIRGVADAKARIADPTDYLVRTQVQHELVNKLWEVLK